MISVPLSFGSTGGFSPKQLGGLKLWLKADSLNLNNGDLVSFLTDLSESGNDLIQSNSSLQPSFITNIFNGLPIIRFTDTPNNTQMACTPGLSLDSNFTAFFAVHLIGNGGAYNVLLVDDADNNGFFSYQNHLSYYIEGYGNNLSSRRASHSQNIMCVTYDGGLFNFYLNGTYLNSGANSSPNHPVLKNVGGDSAGDVGQFDFGECIYYNRLLNQYELDQVYHYLKRWGIQDYRKIEIINASKAISASIGSSTTVSLTPISGNLLVAIFVGYDLPSGGTSSTNIISDNINGSVNWIKVAGVDSGSANYSSMWYLKNCEAGITSVTVAPGTSSSLGHVLIIHELSGCSLTNPFTTGEVQTLGLDFASRTQTPHTSSLITSTENSIIFALLASDSASASSLNYSGTTEFWGYFNSNSANTDTSCEQVSVVNDVGTYTDAYAHVWNGNEGGAGQTLITAAFHG